MYRSDMFPTGPVTLKLQWTVMILQIKNSLAKAFSRKKSGAGKSETGTTADSDSISILSDISVADSAAECLPTPAVRTADWCVQCSVEFFSVYGKTGCIWLVAWHSW